MYRQNRGSRSEKPKIVHVITRMDMGGSAQNTLQTCIGLAHNYDTLLVYGPTQESQMTFAQSRIVKKDLDKALENGVQTVVIQTLVRAIQPLSDFVTLFALYRLFKENKPDIVHTHTSKAGLLGRWAAKLSGVPHILHTAHGHVFYGHFDPFLAWAFLNMERITSRITERIVALTEGERQDYLDLSMATSQKLETIHSGVQIKRFSERLKDSDSKTDGFGKEKGKKIVGTVGWLLPIKGSMILFDAMQRVWQRDEDVLLVYVGQGSEGEKIRQKAARLNIEGRVKFLGWRNDIESILPLFDIFVLPSLNEGMGRVIVEAMASGLPVIASNTGGIPDLVAHGTNGYLVPPGDAAALAAAISILLENSELAERMGKFGRERCKRFSLESMLDKLDRLYTEILN